MWAPCFWSTSELTPTLVNTWSLFCFSDTQLIFPKQQANTLSYKMLDTAFTMLFSLHSSEMFWNELERAECC